jgi:hypothetical protein
MATAMLTIPRSVKSEHGELHSTLVRATREEGPLGEAAKAVARMLEPHFFKEEQFALPPLGLLPRLARGEAIGEAHDVLALTDRLEHELGAMLEDHRRIVAALSVLLQAARAGDKVEYAEFAEHLIRHAELEEQILYPAALLVGRYLRLKAAPGGR